MFDEDHDLFREAVRAFVENELVPNDPAWEANGIVDRDIFNRAGALGFLGIDAPEALGGGGVRDFRFQAILDEELLYANLAGTGLGLSLHNDVCFPYFLELGSDEQQARWIPGMCRGDLVAAIAMTEPGTGSDLASMRTAAVRDGDDFVINGAKTFISNGFVADLVIVACKTDPTQRHTGMSLIVVESDRPGFRRGRNLEKIGLHAQDTAELFFDDVRVPAANLLGDEGAGFRGLVQLLPRERLSLAISGLASAVGTFERTLEYVKDRHAFGQPIGAFQNTRFRMAEMKTELDIAQVFVDQQVLAYNDATLTAEDAAEAKWWVTELQGRVVDTCLQLHGGYGYMEEYPIAKTWRDARIQRIYGGTTEIMKEIIGRGLGL